MPRLMDESNATAGQTFLGKCFSSSILLTWVENMMFAASSASTIAWHFHSKTVVLFVDGNRSAAVVFRFSSEGKFSLVNVGPVEKMLGN